MLQRHALARGVEVTRTALTPAAASAATISERTRPLKDPPATVAALLGDDPNTGAGAARPCCYTEAAGNGPATSPASSPLGSTQRIPDPGISVVATASPGGMVSGCQRVAWGVSWYSPDGMPPMS